MFLFMEKLQSMHGKEYGEVSSITFKNELDELGDDIETINLYINSPGGSVFERWLLSQCLQRQSGEGYLLY